MSFSFCTYYCTQTHYTTAVDMCINAILFFKYIGTFTETFSCVSRDTAYK